MAYPTTYHVIINGRTPNYPLIPTYTCHQINLTIIYRSISTLYLVMAESDYSSTILIVKPVGPDAINALRAEHNADRLVTFQFEDSVSNITEYDDARSRECTPYVSRPPEPQLHLKFDPKPRDATRGFIFGSDESKCDVQLLNGRKLGSVASTFASISTGIPDS